MGSNEIKGERVQELKGGRCNDQNGPRAAVEADGKVQEMGKVSAMEIEPKAKVSANK